MGESVSRTKARSPDADEGILIAIENQDSEFSLGVDRIIGMQQGVVKELEMVDAEPDVFDCRARV